MTQTTPIPIVILGTNAGPAGWARHHLPAGFALTDDLDRAAVILVCDSHDQPATRALRELKSARMRRTVVVTGIRHALYAQVLGRHHVAAVVRAEVAELHAAVHAIASGHRYVTPTPDLAPRQAQVLARVLEGMDTAEIARGLGISAKTVNAHVSSVLTGSGIASRSQLVSRVLMGPVTA